MKKLNKIITDLRIELTPFREIHEFSSNPGIYAVGFTGNHFPFPTGEDIVKKGDIIATLGSAEVNGDYAPHLHFQIIRDMEGKTGDYPGVASARDLKHFQDNCPDPNLLLKIS